MMEKVIDLKFGTRAKEASSYLWRDLGDDVTSCSGDLPFFVLFFCPTWGSVGCRDSRIGPVALAVS